MKTLSIIYHILQYYQKLSVNNYDSRKASSFALIIGLIK